MFFFSFLPGDVFLRVDPTTAPKSTHGLVRLLFSRLQERLRAKHTAYRREARSGAAAAAMGKDGHPPFPGRRSHATVVVKVNIEGPTTELKPGTTFF